MATAAKKTTGTKTRTRTRAVETPGEAEVGHAPVTHKEVAGVLEEQHLEGEFLEREQPKVDFVQEVEAEGAHRHAGYTPQLGDQWGGKVLTVHGWLLADHPLAQPDEVDATKDETEE